LGKREGAVWRKGKKKEALSQERALQKKHGIPKKEEE